MQCSLTAPTQCINTAEGGVMHDLIGSGLALSHTVYPVPCGCDPIHAAITLAVPDTQTILAIMFGATWQ